LSNNSENVPTKCKKMKMFSFLDGRGHIKQNDVKQILPKKLFKRKQKNTTDNMRIKLFNALQKLHVSALKIPKSTMMVKCKIQKEKNI